MVKMKSLFNRLVCNKVLELIRYIRKGFFDDYCVKSYSQEGEDMILRRFFERQRFGLYVDVGAHHPFRFSNTYYFYKQGWRGINIDAMPGSMKSFQKFRARDTNLEIPVSNSDQIQTYYMFNEPALNGFSKELSQKRNGQNGQFIQQEIKLSPLKLASVLDKYLPGGADIDFLSVDVEGLDFDILQSNDWSKYKPKVILVEILGSCLADVERGEISLFLKKHGYTIFAKAVNTVFFIQQSLSAETIPQK